MSGDVSVELWLHEYKARALEAALDEYGVTLQDEMQARLADLYADMVPLDMRREIDQRIEAEGLKPPAGPVM